MKEFRIIFRKSEYFEVPVPAKNEEKAIKKAIEYLNTCPELYHMEDKNEFELYLTEEIE